MLMIIIYAMLAVFGATLALCLAALLFAPSFDDVDAGPL